MKHINGIIQKLEKKLERQKQAVEETRQHLEFFTDRQADRDQRRMFDDEPGTPLLEETEKGPKKKK